MAAKDGSRNGSSVGYREIADRLAEEIVRRSLSDGSMLPTERELSARFEVSRSTVRRALSHLIDLGMAESSPNRGVVVRRAGSPPQGSNVGFLDSRDWLDPEVFFAISQRLERLGYHLVHVDTKDRGDLSALEFCADSGFVGAILWPKSEFPDVTRAKAAVARVPTVTIDHELRDVKMDVVAPDFLEGGAMLVRHLLAQGRRRVAVTGLIDMVRSSHERFSGVLKGLLQAGVTPDPCDFVFSMTSGHHEAPALRPLIRRMQDEDRPDALVVLHDVYAPSAIEALQDLGLSVPEDVAVAAFGPGPLFHVGDWGLTTVATPMDLIAESVVERLTAQIDGDREQTHDVILPMRLQVFGSCGAPRSEWSTPPTGPIRQSMMWARSGRRVSPRRPEHERAFAK